MAQITLDLGDGGPALRGEDQEKTDQRNADKRRRRKGKEPPPLVFFWGESRCTYMVKLLAVGERGWQVHLYRGAVRRGREGSAGWPRWRSCRLGVRFFFFNRAGAPIW